MTNNQKNYKKTAASGVFYTDGNGTNPNNPAPAYLGLSGVLTDEDIDVTAGKITLTQFNQEAQLNNGALAPADGFDLSRAYGDVLRQAS
jgi:hypothetical protein